MDWPDLSPDPQLLEGVRTRPAMYFGVLGPRGNLLAISHLIDESIGRHLDGKIETIEVRLHENQSVSITETLTPCGASDAERIFASLLNESRVSELGTSAAPQTTFHCLQPCVTAAGLEVEFAALTHDCTLRQTFEKGYPAESSREAGSELPTAALRTHWMPDPEVMESKDLSVDELIARLRVLSYLVPGLTISFRADDMEALSFTSAEGLSEYVRLLASDHTRLHNPVHASCISDGVFIDLAFVHVRASCTLVNSYANHHLTHAGGSHVEGLREGLAEVLREVDGQLKPEPPATTKVGSGLIAVVSVRLQEPCWAGSTAGILGNPEIKPIVAKVAAEASREACRKEPDAWRWVARIAHLSSDPYRSGGHPTF